MWSLDPAIRDHVGLAECAWDFNRPDSIPGFGPIGATPSAPSFFSRPAISEAADTAVPVPSAQAHEVATTPVHPADPDDGSDEHTTELPSPKRNSYPLSLLHTKKPRHGTKK